MSKITLYSLDMSPPCRAVLMTAHEIGVELNICETNILKGDAHTEKYLKMNPMHTIPVMDDNGFILWDSHAIMGYLMNKYAKDDSLYPKDPQKRALVDQYMYFDIGTLFQREKTMFKQVAFHGEKSFSQEHKDSVKEALGWFNTLLEGKKWLVGDSYTLADITCVCAVATIDYAQPVDEFPNVKAWFERCRKEIPSYEICAEPGVARIRAYFDPILA